MSAKKRQKIWDKNMNISELEKSKKINLNFELNLRMFLEKTSTFPKSEIFFNYFWDF